MRTLRAWILRFAALFSKRRTETEIAAEIESNLRLDVDEGMRKGLAAEEARRRALIRLGGAEQAREAWRDRRGIPFLETLARDIVYSFRMMGRSKGWTAAAVLSLALGIGANTALFNVVNSLIIEKLPVEDPDTLVVFHWGGEDNPGSNSSTYGSVPPDPVVGALNASFPLEAFEAFRDNNRTLSDLFAFLPGPQINLIANGEAGTAESQYVTGTYFAALGIPAALGRTITPADDQAEAGAIVVLSHEYWNRRFAGNPEIVGERVTVNGVSATIIGIQAPGYGDMQRVGSTSPDAFIPLAFEPTLGQSFSQNLRIEWSHLLMGRRRPGTTLDQVEANFSGIFTEIAERERGAALETGHVLRVRDGSRGVFGPNRSLGMQLAVPGIVFGVVLLIVCVNLANLFLFRNEARRNEMAIRSAIGATRGRLLRQLLTESVSLAVIGGGLGVLVAHLSHGALVPAFGTRIDTPTTLLYAFTLSVATGAAFGLVPAIRTVRKTDRGAAAAAGVTRSGSLLGSSLLAAQVAMSLALLVAAGLFLGTLDRLQEVDPGLDTDNVLLFDIEPRFGAYDDNRVTALYAELIARLSELPGVGSVTHSNGAPLSGSSSGMSVYVEAESGPIRGPDHGVRGMVVGARFFETMGIPIHQGRGFTGSDVSTAPQVAVVNEAFAEAFFPGMNPIGSRFFRSTNDSGPLVEVVGVVGNTHHLGLREGEVPVVYRPYDQENARFFGSRRTFGVRSAVSSEGLISSAREIVRQIDANLPLLNVTTMSSHLERNWQRERQLALTSSFFGGLALIVSMIGLFGMMSYSVARRTKEIGIRMALGADRRGILSSILTEALTIVSVGLGVGTAAALGTTRFLESMLFGLAPNDPATILAAILVMLAVSTLAAYVPARRASRVNPIVALREE